MPMNNKAFSGAASAAMLALAACMPQAELASTTPESPSEATVQTSFGQFPDIPSPGGSKLVLDRTLVLGSGDNWVGQLVINASAGPFALFDFLKQKMPEFGWTEVTSVRAPISVLTYQRQSRVASIQIQARTLTGSEMVFTVSPSEGQSGAAFASPSPSPVRSAPLGKASGR
ncbi:MAG: hypothetical protein H7841_17885 [Magnetospirillum sp. WYHS-4]